MAGKGTEPKEKKKRKKPENYTQNAVALLKADGWEVIEKVEQRHNFMKAGKLIMWKTDLCGAFDLLCLSPGKGFLGVQVCRKADISTRIKKMIAEPRVIAFLKAPGRVQVLGFQKDEDGVTHRIEELTYGSQTPAPDAA